MAEKVKMLIPEEEVNARIEELEKRSVKNMRESRFI